jgi:tripartite-type tricarboxylate transporter receptor subunit TctC
MFKHQSSGRKPAAKVRPFKAHFAALLAMVCLFGSGNSAFAQPYPNKPLRFVVPMAAGGSVDIVSRSVAQVLSQKLGQSIVVDNKPGAGGSLAAAYVSSAAPDGYTVFVADTGQLSINPSLYKKLPYDTNKLFVPVTEAVAAPLYLAVNSELPIKSVQELIAFTKAQSAPLTFASTGVGSVHHLGMEYLASKTGMKVNHIPYKGGSPAATALAAGEVQAAFLALSSLKPFLASGKVRILAVGTSQRNPATPDIPTVTEAGVTDFSVAVNIGFVLPPNTPDAIAQKLHNGILEALGAPEVQKQLASLGFVPIGNTSAQFGQNIQNDLAKYRTMIKLTGASAE